MYIRNCPICSKEIVHKNINSYRHALKLKKQCVQCGCKEAQSKPEVRKNNSIRQKGKRTGNKNPFYGKHHTDKTKQILSDKTKEQLTIHGNPMQGKSFFDIWLIKYGEQIANEKQKELNQKRSENVKGEKNPMFGKPSPKGSGSGWQGWYKEIYFRSLLELSFLVNYVEKLNLKMINAECKQYGISYIGYNNEVKTYFADYLIDDKFLIEIKPLSLHNALQIQLKAKAGENFCKENNLTYVLMEPEKLNLIEIENLLIDGNLIFSDTTNKKYIKYKNGKQNKKNI